jgi:hypothetical protein
VLRWNHCCCLVLGLAVLTADNRTSLAAVEPKSTPEVSNFGLQVQVGANGITSKSPTRTRRSAAQQVSYTDGERAPSDADRLDLVNWQEESQEMLPVAPQGNGNGYEWQVLPEGLMYKTYLAGEKESRMAAVWLSSKGRNGIVRETALGGHVGLLRYGNTDAIHPEGWQLDLEGAALPRVDMGNNDDLESCDFRAGFLSTWRKGANAYKAGYYHLSSHAGDEYLIRNPSFQRLNYVRDSVIVGWTHFLTDDAQVYGEVAYAFNCEDGAEPLELQYGVQYSPMVFGMRGAPFAAINGHTRQDYGFITSVNVQAGWQWRGTTNHTYRLGMQYYTGPAMQWEFSGMKETLFGGGMWMDY